MRKSNLKFQTLNSQVTQQVAERFYQDRQRSFAGLANKPKVKKPHNYLARYRRLVWRRWDKWSNIPSSLGTSVRKTLFIESL